MKSVTSPRLCTLVSLLGALASADAAVVVNLDATSLPLGSLPVWDNLVSDDPGRDFTRNAAGTAAVVNAPGATPVRSVLLNGGANFYVGPEAPEGIAGSGQRSVEAWVLNPALADEETIIGWGRRGGPDATNFSFNYGANATYGAVGHWGGADMGWNGNPTANLWHHLVYTYDGSTVRLYADGTLRNSAPRTLSTHYRNPASALLKFVVGGQNDANGNPVVTNSGIYLARVRVHDAVLSPGEIAASYFSEAASFGIATPPQIASFSAAPPSFLPAQPVALTWNVVTPPGKPLTSLTISNGIGTVTGNTGSVTLQPETATTYTITAVNADGTATAQTTVAPRSQPLVLRHRWSFNEPAGPAAANGPIPDRIGDAGPAFVRGSGATWTGSGLRLPGGASASAPYADLPNGILSNRSGDATFEGWVSINGSSNWSRLVDFGSSLANGGSELLAPGGTGNGDEYIILSAQIGGTMTQNRFEFREGGVSATADVPVPYTAGSEFHFAIVYDADGGSGGLAQMRYFRNGQLLSSIDTGKPLASIRDNNNWLGRSNWTADANLNGTFNEFRVWDGAMHQEDVAASVAAGPDPDPIPTPFHIDLFAPDRFTIYEGESTTLHWRITDPLSSTTTSIDRGIGTVATPNAGSVTISPATTTTYTISTSNGASARSQPVTVTVLPAAPVTDSQSVLVPLNQPQAITLTARDPRSLPLTWQIVSAPGKGSLSGTAPNLVYMPGKDFAGSDEFTVRTSNGSLVSNLASVRLFIRPDAPVADSQAVEIPSGRPRQIRLTAMDPDNEPLTWSIVSPPSHGSLSGTPPLITYTPSPGYAGPDSFQFQVNDATLASNAATVSLTVCPPSPPQSITLSADRIRTDDTPGRLIARLSAVDPGCRETHSFSLVDGDGSTDNAAFSIIGNQLIAQRNFANALGQRLSVRIRVTDETGLSTERIFAFTVSLPNLHVQINEVYYNSPNNRTRAEFVELHNPLGDPVNLSGWRFTGGIGYTFPAGTIIPPDGFLVIAQDPATVKSLWGTDALGPWTGGLSSDGEIIELSTAAGIVADSVDYGIQTPWPVSPNGQGPSLELVHPSLDNDLGSNWRASTGGPAATTFVPRGTAGWSFRPGRTEASDPIAAWTENGYAQDSTWRAGTAPIGLFKINSNAPVATFPETGVTLRTQLTAAATGLTTDMATFSNANAEVANNFTVNYQSVFFRRSFEITSTPPAALTLKVMRNDAAIVWINGREVARFGFAANAPANPPANFGAVYERGNDPWSETVLTNAAAYLVSGTNTIAIQGWANDPRLRGGPNGQDDPALYNVFDFCIDAELSTASSFKATPGSRNSVFDAAGTGPAIRSVTHSPQQPHSGNPLTVTARISDRQGIGSASLLHQIVAPGAFLPAELPRTNAEILSNVVANPDYPRLPNPAFEAATAWTSIPMSDDGSVPGDTAGDGIFTAIIPPQPHRSLVRYRVATTDTAGASSRAPAADDPSRNFAAFVYNGTPPYANGQFTAIPQDLESLPVYHWIMRSADFDRLMAYNAADQFANNNQLSVLLARRFYNFEGALVYDGKVYDHVDIRLRGGNSRYNGAGKRHFRFKFPRGYPFAAKDNKGNPYPRDWEDMLFNKLFGNKGDYDWGLPYRAGEKLWGLQGIPMPYNHWVHFRVVRNAAESSNATTGNDFFGLYQALELPDGRNFLAARDLPRGNFYKMSDYIQNGEMDERYQAPGAPDHAEDFDNIRYNIHPTTPQADMEKFVHMPLWYKYNAVQEAIRHYDIFIEPTGRHRVKNLYWYFHPGTLNPDGSRTEPLGQCWFLPYDWDASFGPNWNNGFDFVNNALYNRNDVPDSPTWQLPKPDRAGMQIQHRNAIREFRDLVFHRSDPGNRGPVDEILDDASSTLARFWQADASRWPAPGAASWRSLTSKADDMKAFCFTGWNTIAGEPAVGSGGRAAYLDAISDGLDAGQLPATPAISYSGAAGFPIDGLRFSVSAFSDPQGPATFAAIQWRAGEITDPTSPDYSAADDRIFEATEVWTSGEITNPAGSMTIPAGALRPGHTYRVRARYKDNTGRFSHWSPPAQFTTTPGTAVASLQQFLLISEILYKPAAPSAAETAAGFTESDFEFVELTNAGITPLDLTGVRFTKGIDFDFAPGTTLAPGASIVVAANVPAFTARYGQGLPVAGSWQQGQSLSNAGEQLKLSFGAGDAIHDITYDDRAPWPAEADHGGISLVYAGPSPTAGSPDPQEAGSNWQPSQITGGTPGRQEFLSLTAWMRGNQQSDPDADPDGDGWSHFATYAFGRDLRRDPATATAVTEGASQFLEFTFIRRRGLPDTSWSPESAAHPAGPWSPEPVTTTSITNLGDGTESVTLRLTEPTSASPQRFLRVRTRVIP
jgi:hypothetical protein